MSKITKQGIVLLYALLALIPAGLTLALLRFAGGGDGLLVRLGGYNGSLKNDQGRTTR